MNGEDDKLSRLLRTSRPAADALPALPPRFQEGVWRRLQAESAADRAESWLDALAALILRPRFALTALAVLLIAGAALGTYRGSQTVQHDAQMRYLAAVAPHAQP